MKSFLEYIIESALGRADYAKHDFQYLIGVINDIVNVGKIGLGQEKIDSEIEINQNVRDAFAKYVGNESNLSYDDFNNIAKTNDTPFAWNKIFKGKYSGQEHQSAGEYAEAAVAYIFNNMNGNTQVVESDSVDFEKIVKTLADKNITADWIASSKLSAEKLHKSVKSPKEYTAAHVDGKDISKVPDSVLAVAKIFKGKPGIKEVLGNIIDKDALNNLYATGKDTWNKADIILVNSKLDMSKELQGKHFAISDEFNAFLNDLINRNLIIPVSLKKIAPKATLEQIKFEKEGKVSEAEKVQTEVDKIQFVEIYLPKTVTKDKKFTGTCYLKTNSDLRIDFRHGTEVRESLNIEIKLKTARGGKALSELKRKLGLTSDFYKKYYFDTENEWISEIERLTGKKLSVPKTLSESDQKWFIRPAFKGLVALLSIYQTNIQQNNKKVNLNEFFRMLYNCASGANSESIFWLLTMK